MSSYAATGRTNRFLVKDVEALKSELISYGITPATRAEGRLGASFVLAEGDPNEPAGSVTLFSYGPWPSFDEDHIADRLDLDDDSDVPREYEALHDLVAKHLVAGQVAIFRSIGSEAMRYLGGSAVAVNSFGETRSVDLDDIDELAQQLTTPNNPITHASS